MVNLAAFDDIELMFYQNITTYNWFCSEKQLKTPEKKRTPLAAFKDHGQFILPSYFYNYPYLFIINMELTHGLVVEYFMNSKSN